jgi:hypothetical protein
LNASLATLEEIVSYLMARKIVILQSVTYKGVSVPRYLTTLVRLGTIDTLVSYGINKNKTQGKSIVFQIVDGGAQASYIDSKSGELIPLDRSEENHFNNTLQRVYFDLLNEK